MQFLILWVMPLLFWLAQIDTSSFLVAVPNQNCHEHQGWTLQRKGLSATQIFSKKLNEFGGEVGIPKCYVTCS